MVIEKELDSRISYSNIPDLDEVDMPLFVRTLNGLAEKRMAENSRLSIHCKTHKDKNALRKKHSVHLKLTGHGNILSAEASGWSFLSVLQSAIKKLSRQAKRK